MIFLLTSVFPEIMVSPKCSSYRRTIVESSPQFYFIVFDFNTSGSIFPMKFSISIVLLFSYFRKHLPNDVFNLYCFWSSYFRKHLPNDFYLFLLDASIYYTLIIKNFTKALWCVIFFTLDIAHVFHCRSSWYRGTCDF